MQVELGMVTSLLHNLKFMKECCVLEFFFHVTKKNLIIENEAFVYVEASGDGGYNIMLWL